MGCEGRLWETTAPLVHNLKQQARDGTIAEVLRLPLIGWRVKTETKPVLRNKRQAAVDDYGECNVIYCVVLHSVSASITHFTITMFILC